MKDIRVTRPTQIDVDANFPVSGRARNIVTSGDGTGTPWSKDIINDRTFGWQERVLSLAGIVADGNEENASQSQIADALEILIKITSSGYNAAGSFQYGFTYTSDTDVGVYQGQAYKYVGANNYPVEVSALTNPVGNSDYEVIAYSSKPSSTIINNDNSNAQNTYDLVKSILVSNGLSGEYGYFADGFTLSDPLDVGIDANYQFWKYVGTRTLPYAVPQETDPSAGDWSVVRFDRNYIIYDSVSNMINGIPEKAKIGDYCTVNDYYGGIEPSNSGVLFFKCVANGSGTDDGGKYIQGDGVQFEQNVRLPANPLAWGAKLNRVDDDTVNIQKALNYTKTLYFNTCGFKLSDTIKSNNSFFFITEGIVDIEYVGADNLYWNDIVGNEAGLFDLNSKTEKVSFLGNFRFTSQSATFNGPYLRSLGGEVLIDGCEFYDSYYTVTRNSSRATQFGDSKGKMSIKNCIFDRISHGPRDVGLSNRWWDQKENTTELELIRNKITASERTFTASLVSTVINKDNEFIPLEGVCYTVPALMWSQDDKWSVDAGVTTRQENYIETSIGQSGSISINLLDLGFSVGDEGYILLECSVNKVSVTTDPTSSMSINSEPDFKTDLRDPKLAKFTVTDDGGQSILNVNIGDDTRLSMINLLIYKQLDELRCNEFVGWCNKYDATGNQYLGIGRGPTAGLNCRFIFINKNKVLGGRAGIDIDNVSVTDPQNSSFPNPDSFAVVSENILFGCYSHVYMTGGHIQFWGNVLHGVGHYSDSNISIAVRAQDRQTPQSYDSNTQVNIYNNKWIACSDVALGKIFGNGRLIVGDGNIHDAKLPSERSAWQTDTSAGSRITYTSAGQEVIPTYTDSTYPDMYQPKSVINANGNITLTLPKGDANGDGLGQTAVFYSIGHTTNQIRFDTLTARGSINGVIGGDIYFPVASKRAEVTSISDQGDYIVTFS